MKQQIINETKKSAEIVRKILKNNNLENSLKLLKQEKTKGHEIVTYLFIKEIIDKLEETIKTLEIEIKETFLIKIETMEERAIKVTEELLK